MQVGSLLTIITLLGRLGTLARPMREMRDYLEKCPLDDPAPRQLVETFKVYAARVWDEC